MKDNLGFIIMFISIVIFWVMIFNMTERKQYPNEYITEHAVCYSFDNEHISCVEKR